MSGDDERDPHLREALRHAPDAQLQPPAALSALILQEARAKARDPQPAAASPAAGPLAALWAWLARPAVATGFAGVMAATLVGLMWWDRPMDEAMPRSPVPTMAPAPAIAEAPPAPASSAAQQAPAGVTTEAEKALRRDAAGPTAAAPAKPAAPAATPPAAPLAKKSAPAEEAKRADAEQRARQQRSADERLRAAAPKAEQAPAAAADRAAPAESRAEPVREAMAPPPPAPAAPAAVAPAPAPAGAGANTAQGSLAGGVADAPRRLAAKAEFNDTRTRLEAEAFTGIASLRAEVATEPSQWQWQRSGGTPQPMSDAVYAWLAQLDSATARRWQPAQAGGSAPVTRALQLWRDGRLQHSVWLTEREVLWQRGQTSWRATLGAEQLAALKAALDSAAP